MMMMIPSLPTQQHPARNKCPLKLVVWCSCIPSSRLTAAALNGKSGLVTGHDASTGRWIVALLTDNGENTTTTTTTTRKVITVKDCNCEHLPLPAVQVRKRAYDLACEQGNYQAALQVDPTCVMAMICLGQEQIMGSSGNHNNSWKAALPYFQKAVAQSYAAPAHQYPTLEVQLRFQLGNIYGELQQVAMEESQIRGALKLAPYYIQAKYNLTLCLKNQNRLDEALALLEQIQKDSPKDIEADNLTRNKAQVQSMATLLLEGTLHGIISRSLDEMSRHAEPALELVNASLGHVERLLEVSNQLGNQVSPDSVTRSYAKQAFFLAYKAFVFQQADCEAASKHSMEQALALERAVQPACRGYVHHTKAKLLELEADFTENPEQARNLLQ